MSTSAKAQKRASTLKSRGIIEVPPDVLQRPRVLDEWRLPGRIYVRPAGSLEWIEVGSGEYTFTRETP
jgi:hypothetical protein